MRKYVLVMIMAGCVLLSGCNFMRVKPAPTLNVYWRNVQDAEIRTLTSEEGGLNVGGGNYSFTPGRLSRVMVEIEADLDGETDKEFEFELTTQNSYKQVAPNKVVLEPEHPEKGLVKVSAEGQEKLLEYEIFPSGAVHKGRDYIYEAGFDLEKGTPAIYGHIYPAYNNPPAYGPAIKANVCILDAEHEDFWEDFVSIKDVTGYEYTEMEFDPEFRKLYLIKTDNGYAVVKFSASTGYTWQFIYKYSETGVFE